MNQDDIEKNRQKFCTIKIPIPAYNDYPLKDIHRWAKKAYHQVYIKVGWRKAQKIKGIMPIEMADYAERKTFGNWRLVAPAGPQSRRGEVTSPLQQAIEWVMPHIVPTRWGKFRRKFVKLLKLAFNAICDADYDEKMVDEVNGMINRLLAEFSRTAGEISIHFRLLLKTAEFYSSPRLLEIRSRIWERFTGKPLDLNQYRQTLPPGPGSPRQMDMHLDLSVT